MLKEIGAYELRNHDIQHVDTPSCFQFPTKNKSTGFWTINTDWEASPVKSDRFWTEPAIEHLPWENAVGCIGESPAIAAESCCKLITQAGFDVNGRLLKEMYSMDLSWKEGVLEACRAYGEMLDELVAYPEESTKHGLSYFHFSIRWDEASNGL